MPPFYRFLEVGAFSLLNFLPFLVLALYPFRAHLRFSWRATNLMIAGLTVIQLGLGVWAAFFADGHAGLISAMSTLLYAAFYLFAVKMPFGKPLFTLLMLSNVANFAVLASKCIEGQIWPQMAVQSYRWSFALSMLGVESVLLIPLFFYIKVTFTPTVEKDPSGFEWKYLWLIPATFYLIWYYAIYGNLYRTSLQIALRPTNVIFFFIINQGAFLIYYMVAKLVREQQKNMELRASNHWLILQALQYENLQGRITEARRSKHDMHHHIALIRQYVKNHQYDELDAYLSHYQEALPDDTFIVFCQNPTVNAMLLYFAQQAKNREIDYDVKLDVPKQLPVAETDISVLLGNLLENALDACATEIDPNRKIVIRGRSDTSAMYLTLDNTFTGTLQPDGNGGYRSTKHKGAGIGIESARNIAERYGGAVQIEQRDGLFCVSAFLHF